MGLDELLNTLRKNEQKQIEEIWQQAKAEAGSIRKQAAEAIVELTKEHEDQLESACQKSIKAILAGSEKKAREKKLFVYQDLSQALLRAAVKQLPKLRQADYENIFTQLVNELPDVQWERIAVNPSDLDLAAKFFSNDIVYPDAAVSGGLIAAHAEGRIIIDNTFKKRLERKWAFILPALIKNIEKRYDEIQPAEKA